MKNRFFVVLSGAICVIGMQAVWASAEDNLQPYVNSYGRVILTNLVGNSPSSAAASLPQTTDVLTPEMPASLRALVDAISKNHGVDPGLIRAVMKTESNFNRWAVSNKGALGLMQLIPSTGRRYGVRDFFDPEQNIDGGVRYIKFLLQKFNGDLDLSLAAYNAGENLVERLGRVPPIPETATYVRKVRAIYKKKSAPVTPSAVSPASADASATESPKLYKMVDGRGVLHFSNIEPPN